MILFGTNNPTVEVSTQWPKEKGQSDKQRSTKHTHKTKDRVTRTPLKPGVNSGKDKHKWLKIMQN
jgi:LysM repeat protein